jgi:hypothetical protein
MIVWSIQSENSVSDHPFSMMYSMVPYVLNKNARSVTAKKAETLWRVATALTAGGTIEGNSMEYLPAYR